MDERPRTSEYALARRQVGLSLVTKARPLDTKARNGWTIFIITLDDLLLFNLIPLALIP